MTEPLVDTKAYPNLWTTEQLVVEMHRLAAHYYEKERDTAAGIVAAAATRLHNYKLWSRKVTADKDKVENKLVIPTDRGTGERMMKWLSYEHLPPELQWVVMNYNELGHTICTNIPPSPERTVALRKLVESKDCAVRAIIESMEKQ